MLEDDDATDLPEPQPQQTVVRLATPWPHDMFNPGIEDVPVITAAGVDVPAGKAQAVKDAWTKAFAHRVRQPAPIREVTS